MGQPKNIDPWKVRVLLRTYPVKDVARRLGCDRRSIYRIMHTHDIPYNYRPGARTDLTL